MPFFTWLPNGPLPLAVLSTLDGKAEKHEWEGRIEEKEKQGWKAAYTDGSRIAGKTGVGLWKGKPTSHYLGARATVNDAELIAMARALDEGQEEILLITDSRVAVQRLKARSQGLPTPGGAAHMVRTG
ncbi:hypothetical protein BDZ91DRAFT_792832 [Kalaharituber pfeilii]|nr:hypothetical protein BDZ91DRAFT_792832 [Kalaharituber pfeilii]